MAVKGSSSNWGVFGRAAWETLTDLKMDYDVDVNLGLWPSYRRGVFIFEAVATKVMSGGEGHDICRVQAEFPNSRSETVEAFLYSLTTKIAHCVQAWEASAAVEREKAAAKS